MILETIKMGIRSLGTNKLRTILSMLGIVIGVASVIATVSIASGTSSQVTDRIASLGSNLITINEGFTRSFGRISTAAQNVFTLELGSVIKQYSPAVARVVPNSQSSGLLINGSQNMRATLVGTTVDYQDVYAYYPARGKFFSDYDVANATSVIVLGSELKTELYGDEDPIGRTIVFNYSGHSYVFRVIGVMAEKSTGIGGNLNSQAFIPITTYQNKISNSNYVSSFAAQAVSSSQAKAAVQQIEHLLTRYFGDDDKFRLLSQDQMLETISEVTGTMQLMLGGIAAISLLVGGIGIMNIMLVSVTERTREIGIRKALGAKSKHVLGQFLVEALTLSSFGGILGVGLGAVGAYFVAQMGGWPFVVTAIPVLVAFSFSLLIGMFFGIYPAVKAAKLDPVAALSYE